ncbi:hypothetical protein ROZALSC1DRAFT_30942 [Rozella allomycis CSF55]|uniref:Uncharacterized protein n=1 Tax=Rozella allomycis (strain CSF55) TaxID=988480 RepID=A0A4P9YDH5_ROZAC|nr:hypothetical protein ROZALSC1DRAFT_30942 [Rozella allomycis CSF55]
MLSNQDGEIIFIKSNIFLTIAGISRGTNGRSCSIHETCGMELQLGQIIVCELAYKRNSNALYWINLERPGKSIEKVEGELLCHVRYLSSQHGSHFDQLHGKFFQVVEINRGSWESRKECGTAKCVLLK